MVVMVRGRKYNFIDQWRKPDLFNFDPGWISYRAHALLILNELDYQDPTEAWTLYVGQREYAIVPGTDEKVRFVGSDGASTCHIVILHHKESNGVAVAHFDASIEDFRLQDMVDSLVGDSEEKSVDVYASGGLIDWQEKKKANKVSREISSKIVNSMVKLKNTFNIVQWCCGYPNTKKDKQGRIWPAVRGMFWDRKEGLLYNASFKNHGPCVTLRYLSMLSTSGTMRKIYDSEGYLTVEPFTNFFERGGIKNYKNMSNEDIMRVSFL